MSFLKNMKMKQKFMCAVAMLVLAAIISVIGMIEIAKTTYLQKLERDHILLSTILNNKTREYISLIKQGTADAESRADNILNARSNNKNDMGLSQLLEELLVQPAAVNDALNFIEEALFRSFGFGIAFDVTQEDIINLNNAIELLEGIKNKKITIERFEDKFFHEIDKVAAHCLKFGPIINSASIFTRNLMITLAVVFLSLAGVFLVFLARMITLPLIQLTTLSEKITRGDLTQYIDLDQRDELGILANSMNHICKNVGGRVGSTAAASQQLSEGASEQAAAIEETSSSLEEIASMTKQNADNAGMTDQLMKETDKMLGIANNSMADLTKSMEELTHASEETQKVVKTIDEVAFQTNLLALNAAVEAARAGEAGAGFAVVASEVRNLALRAADAAKDTAALIEGTVNKVKDGTEIVSTTNNAFSEVTQRAEKVKELISEISAASREQAQGIEEINRAVAEMDKVVQQNAANAEELASNMAMFKVNHARSDNYQIQANEFTPASMAGHTEKKKNPALKIAENPQEIIPMDDDFNDF
ncbi:MAG: HAMP domain-containing protein [Deltaproteobacteria bacterium]|nr:HAMP domain-containing protein [Deltaproteobacteria bacterium]